MTKRDHTGPAAGFAERLIDARTAAGLSVSQLVEGARVPQPTIWNWEAGKRGKGSLSTALVGRVAQCLSVRVEWLLYGTGPQRIGDEQASDEYHRRAAAIALARTDGVREEAVAYVLGLRGARYAQLTAAQWLTLIRAHEATLEDA
jgi:transcriptional regulator with XRE-family HTH domain